MAANPLKALNEAGQCVWLDNLYRDLITTGSLMHMMEDGITGITSNPTIFQKAISGSAAYDESIIMMLRKGITDPKELFLGLAMEDVSRAADVLRPVYGTSKCLSGYVSIEVSPDLAHDTRGTIKEALHLFSAINKKNILVKVPATKEGLPAIEELTASGVNVNVTLLFSIERYKEVAEAYIRGLEQRLRKKEQINEIISVASFFVSRVDTLVDKLLEQRIASSSGEEKNRLTALLGKAAVANAKLAYREYERIFTTSRFLSLKEKGANVQRLLWGSTGTKNPKYSDIKYVDELIGPDTINTMPEATLNAFKDHGTVKITIGEQMDKAEKVLKELASLGISIKEVTDQLEKDGVKAFADSYFALLDEISKRRDRIQAEK
ncbi:MAG TPA: transaldolase [Thermodesulfovibrionales bacterium]|nr:transaldolase [Thermodesulfovibrionales bacterium]